MCNEEVEQMVLDMLEDEYKNKDNDNEVILTFEQSKKALDCCSGVGCVTECPLHNKHGSICIQILLRNIKEYVEHLVDENELLKQEKQLAYDTLKGYSLTDIEQKAEIELLTKRGDELVEDKAHWINKWKEQVECTAELQKQVDELKETLKLRNIQLEDLRKYDKEIVKDTAKEILQQLLNIKCCTLIRSQMREVWNLALDKARKEIAERYDVEVE